MIEVYLVTHLGMLSLSSVMFCSFQCIDPAYHLCKIHDRVFHIFQAIVSETAF